MYWVKSNMDTINDIQLKFKECHEKTPFRRDSERKVDYENRKQNGNVNVNPVI